MKRLIMLPLMFAAFIFILPNEAFSQTGNKKDVVTKMPEDMQWSEIPGGAGGAMNSMIWSDAKTGAHANFTKFPAGFKAPPHSHTSDATIVVIKGAYVYNGKKYGPGSYLFIPGGQQHESGGAEDSETIFYMEQPAAFDLKPVASK
jgi:quercetin dioxygenase-like cupin family protein